MTKPEMTTDVLIVGAGPTGLLLAGDLAEAGVSVTVIERRANESNVTRAFGVHARTMEELDMRGLADQLAKTGARVSALRLFDKVHIDLATLPSRFGYLLITPQYETESVLQQRADALGVGIVHGAEVLGLSQDEDGVDVRVRADGGARTAYRASYVVGADGVNSTVRHSLGLPFPGKSVLKSIMLADVRLTTPPRDVLSVNAVGDGFAFVAPFGDGWYRVFAWDRRNQVDDKAPLELDDIREVARRALGTDLGMHDPRWMSRFHSDERQAPTYRVRRVFLAGDAAHCHSPAGGQGMNTGMQDAANLGWKLAAAVRGWGDDVLLDSYQDERHPVGAMVLRSSGAIIRLAMIKPWLGRRVRNLLGGAALRLRPVAGKVAGMISGVGIRYPTPRGAHPLVGTRMADIELVNGQVHEGRLHEGRLHEGRLYEALRGGRFVLVAAENPGVDLPQVDVVVPARPTDQLVLVRPDGYVAWAGDGAAFPAWARKYFRR